MQKVDITDIDKVELLYGLWLNARVPCSLPHPEFNYTDAADTVKKFINYYHGRSIKCDISKNVVDPWIYNRDYGTGAFEKIVDHIRQNQK